MDHRGPAAATHPCAKCDTLGCTKKCSRCKESFYCSKSCQATHWPQHKRSCNKVKKNEGTEETSFASLLNNIRYVDSDSVLDGLAGRSMEVDRPKGSLDKAISRAKQLFPGHHIITDFGRLPDVPIYGPSVLLAFMFKYHEMNFIRHGVYLKDRKNTKTMVQFYLDYDKPEPYFTWDMVSPGNYLCLQNPAWHYFMDGTTGIRIDEACEVKVINPITLQ